MTTISALRRNCCGTLVTKEDHLVSCAFRDNKPLVAEQTLRQQVTTFHRVFGHPIAPVPTIPNDERVRLRMRIIAEEFFEAMAAVFEAPKIIAVSQVPTGEELLSLQDQVMEFIGVAPIKLNLPEFANALGDLDYVVEGARLEFGIDGKGIADIIHAANMKKAEGGIRIRLDGKTIKPEGWTPPDIEGELRRQGWRDLRFLIYGR